MCKRSNSFFSCAGLWVSPYTERFKGCLPVYDRAHTHMHRHTIPNTKYLQSQNKQCWWNCCDPQTPAVAGHSHHRHQASTLAPESRSPLSPPGSGLWGGTEHSIQMTDVGAPFGPFPEASPHSTLWKRRTRWRKMEILQNYIIQRIMCYLKCTLD